MFNPSVGVIQYRVASLTIQFGDVDACFDIKLSGIHRSNNEPEARDDVKDEKIDEDEEEETLEAKTEFEVFTKDFQQLILILEDLKHSQ